MILKLFYTPFLAYFMALLWAAMIGDTFVFFGKEKYMLEEWIICMVVYIVFMLGLHYDKRRDQE